MLCIAHRGASSVAPENTLEAVTAAVAARADLVEVDVHRTRDGALVVHHDPTLDRTTDVRAVFPGRTDTRVAAFTLDEIGRLDAGRWKRPHFAGARVPTLGEVLGALRGSRTGLLLEVKQPDAYPGIMRDVAAELRATSGALDHPVRRVVVQSFDAHAARELAGLLPGLPVGLLGNPSRSELPTVAEWAGQVNPHHLQADRAYVDAVHDHGLACHVWTVDLQLALRRAVGLGVDGIISNKPHRLRALLDRRLTPVGHDVGHAQ